MCGLKKISAGILIFLSLVISPQASWATKGGTPLSHSVTSTPIVSPGGDMNYRFSVQNVTAVTYVSVMFSANFPAGVTCNSASDAACTLSPTGNSINCMYGTVGPHAAFSVNVNCKVAEAAACNSKLSTTMGLWVKTAPKQDTYATTVSTVQCATPTPTATPVPPTATPTYTPYPPTATPTPSHTPTPRPTEIPTIIPPTATPTCTVEQPTPKATKTPTRTPSHNECNDGQDNDGDGQVDCPNDSGCIDPDDDSEDSQQLRVIKSVAQTVSPGSAVKYSYQVTNTSNKNIWGVIAEDFNTKNKGSSNPIYQQFEYDHAVNADCSCEGGANSVRCELGEIGAGQTRSFEIYFNVPDGKNQCGLDVTNQVDVYESTKNSDYYNWAKATTRVVCDNNNGGQCEHEGEDYFTARYELLDCYENPADRAETQAARIVKRYGLTIAGDPRKNWNSARGYKGTFWYQSKVLRKTLPADQCWFYLVSKTGVLRLWDPNNKKGNPANDIFVAQLGGGLDACGVCGGDTSSCQIR